MKKILSLLALVLMSCMGAWAAEVTVTSTNQLTDGVKVTIKNISKNQYVSLGNTNVAFSPTATVFTLVGNNTDGFKLYDATNTRYVGGTKGNGEQALTKTNASEAGLFTFANYSSYFSIHCENPEQNTKTPFDTAFEYWGLRNQTGTLVTWQLGDAARFEIKIQEPEVSAQQISALQEKIDAVIAKTSASAVGYPIYSNSAVTTLAAYITVLGNPSVTADNYAEAEAALNAVYALTDVNLPEDGKAYTIKAVTVTADGTVDQSFQLYTDNNGVLKCAANGVAATTNTKFIAKAMSENKTVLVNECGEYMIWTCDNATTKAQNTNGFTTTYDAQRNPLSIIHANRTLTNTNTNVTNLTDVQLFGKLEIGGLGKNTSQSWYLVYNSANGGGLFVAGNPGEKYYKNDSNHTFLFQFEEVENPNKVVLTKPASAFEGGLNDKYVGTFSAPYNVELPAGVKAYKAEINDAKTVVTFNELGTVVPKNTGVLVYSESGSAAINENAVPAATASLPEIGTDNIFLPMVNGEIAADNLVLGFTDAEGVMFYPLASAKTVNNKAYIPASAGSNLNAFRFDFEDTVTSIEAIECNTSATVFDLQGRRVQGAKSGLYIVNGKKVVR